MRSADTDSTAERVQLGLIRDATVARRVSLALSLTRMTMQLARRALAQAHPTVDADELAVRFVAHYYGPPLADGLRRDLEARRTSRRP